MRAMLLSNHAVDQHFANGTQGRVVMWHPTTGTGPKWNKVDAVHPELFVRFVKESSSDKDELLPEIDFVDVEGKAETLPCQWRSLPCLIQVLVVPAYALSIHKSQSLTIKHVVKGCLEGIFAHGH
eukprot:9165456-Karenia_brevis.AAC.1